MATLFSSILLGAGALGLGWQGHKRLTLSRAKHRSLAGHVRLAKRIAGQIRFYDYGDDRFFRADDAPNDVAALRRAGFERLSALFKQRFARTLALTAEARAGYSDLQFTGLYRVPFQFRARVKAALPVGAFLDRAEGPVLIDLDGNRLIDLTGSYGVNLFGNEFYKATMAEGAATAVGLGAVLGGLHPVVADNVRRLKALTGLDEVSFHMSGTEAVMQAVRLARYHSRRARVVRFAGAYHGWWGDVQPGIGNPVPADRTLTLADMSEASLRVLARRRDIACVLVNPLQALHPNAGAPSDSTMVDGARPGGVDRDAYAAWLKRLAAVCAGAGVVLIFDEVFVGFRLAPGGAAEYFGVRPDLVTYGKTLGGGFPVGALVGRAALMKRYREDRPADICFARGTFNAHPHVMGAMDAFLRRLETPEIARLYRELDARWNDRAATLNGRLAAEGLPIRVANLSTIWLVRFLEPSRYHWMLQYHLRAEGLALSWVGSGRLIFSLDIDDALFADIADRFVRAARAMRDEGWWWRGPSAKAMRRQVLEETVRARLGWEQRGA